MRKITFLMLMLALVTACKSGQSTSSMTAKPKETNIADKAIKGEWTLKSITYSEKGKFEVTLLNDTSKECFEGSTWKFVPNNNRGHYTINASDCSIGQRNFVFFVQEVDKSTGYYDFMLKPTNEKYESSSNQGLRIHLASLSEDTMVWEQTVRLDGKPFVITMNFVK